MIRIILTIFLFMLPVNALSYTCYGTATPNGPYTTGQIIYVNSQYYHIWVTGDYSQPGINSGWSGCVFYELNGKFEWIGDMWGDGFYHRLQKLAYTPVPPPDSDGDGVSDALDLCPDTAPGIAVNESGCNLVPDHCSDLELTGDETGIDCGGSCPTVCNSVCPDGYRLITDNCGSGDERCTKLYPLDANGNCYINTMKASDYCRMVSDGTNFVIFSYDFCIEFASMIQTSETPPVNENLTMTDIDTTTITPKIDTVTTTSTQTNPDGSTQVITRSTETTTHTDSSSSTHTTETIKTFDSSTILTTEKILTTQEVLAADGTKLLQTSTNTKTYDAAGNVLTDELTTTQEDVSQTTNVPASKPVGQITLDSGDINSNTRFGSRFELFTSNIRSAPVYASLSNIFAPDLSNRDPSYTINAGTLGSYNLTLADYSTSWSVLKKALIFLAMFIAARIILVNK